MKNHYQWGKHTVQLLRGSGGGAALVKIVDSPQWKPGMLREVPVRELRAKKPAAATPVVRPRAIPATFDSPCPQCGSPGYVSGVECPGCFFKESKKNKSQAVDKHMGLFKKFIDQQELNEMANKGKRKRMHTTQPAKEDGPMVINVGLGRTGHIQHASGGGVHAQGPRRQRTRGDQKRSWQREQGA